MPMYHSNWQKFSMLVFYVLYNLLRKFQRAEVWGQKRDIEPTTIVCVLEGKWKMGSGCCLCLCLFKQDEEKNKTAHIKVRFQNRLRDILHGTQA